MNDWQRITNHVSKSIAPFRFKILLTLLLALSASGLGVLEPLIMKFFFDEIVSPENTAVQVIALTVGALFVLTLAKDVIGGMQNWLVWKVRLSLQVDLQAVAVEKLYFLPLTYHQKEGVGTIMTKFDRAINGFVSAFCDIIFYLLPTLAYLVISLCVMFRLDWQLSLVVLFFAPLPALIGMWASKEQIQRERFLMENWAKIYGRFSEAFSSILTVKSFAMERVEASHFLSRVVETNGHVLNGIKTDTQVGAFKNLTVTIARIAAIAFGGYLIMINEITLGTLVAFLGYIGGLFGPVQGLTGVYQTYRKASVSLDILNSILDAEDPVADLPSACELEKPYGEIHFENISFAYQQHKPVFQNLNLHVHPGETVAIVGPSGVGKSTLMALVLRLINPAAGTIKIDGTDIRQLKQSAIRRHIGIVLQDTLLFNDTIRNNIAYGAPHATQAEIEHAAKLANAHDFIMQLPHTYEAMVGERGNNLSGGQKQRIAIARAILKNPAILILDEATSALDAEAEALVQAAFRQLVKGRTTFVISHKMSNIIDADRIIVLKNGQITKIIKPQESLRKDEVFAFS
ncbi:ABC transporter ATP-binding protein [Botryobacter ruber]|uniref:ABC transporter ATP-binding protein n=1 Tax=Botryobacter ruber TaxID=2171629 RepID=UPI000E0A299C|nr:ABC transporter ATP-binding protein [Botryobacter ruber]